MKLVSNRNFLLIIIIFFGFLKSLISQNSLPTVTPSTPESYALSMASNVPIDQSTGQMAFTVPIHNIQIDGNDWPITLQYNYGGFITEAKPSLAGWGWTLNAYGSITRQIRGIADFKPKGYYGDINTGDELTEVQSLINDFVDVSSSSEIYDMPYHKFMAIYRGELDSELDKYVVNIAGKRFSFKVKREPNNVLEPYFLSVTNYKVDIETSLFPYFHISAFTVTDDAGVKYHFTSGDSEDIYATPENPDIYYDRTTSWLLSRIQYINGEGVNFNYGSETWHTWNFSAKAISWNGEYTTPNQLGTYFDGVTGGYNDANKVTLMNRKILNSIDFPKGSLTFHTVEKGPGGFENHKVYDRITLRNNNDQIINDFTLEHLGGRDALVEITKNNEMYYGFDYNQLSFSYPGFFRNASSKPLDQDNYGYYNGANNSQAIANSINGSQVNKEISELHTRKGAMKKIIYPTGGFTEIRYEQNDIKVPYEQSNGSGSGFNRNITLQLYATATNNNRHIERTVTFDYPVRASLSHFISGDATHGNSIYLGIKRLSGPPASDYTEHCYNSATPLNHWYYPLVINSRRNNLNVPDPFDPKPCDVYYPNPILVPNFVTGKDPDNNCPYPPGNVFGCTDDYTINQTGNSGGDFWIIPGTYRFYISTHTDGNTDRPSYFYNDPINSRIRLEYYIPDMTDDGEPFVNDLVGGIRVKEISNFDNTGEKVSKVEYSYYDEDGFSTGVLNKKPQLSETHNVTVIPESGSGITQWTQKNYYLNTYVEEFGNRGVPIYYQKVRKKFEFVSESTSNPTPLFPTVTNPNSSDYNFNVSHNGYVETEYETPFEINEYSYPKVPINTDIQGARKVSERTYDGNSNLLSELETDYILRRHLLSPDQLFLQDNILINQDDNDEHPWSFKIYLPKNRTVDFANNCYSESGECYLDIKMLHKFIRYKEIEMFWMPDEVRSFQDDIETITSYTRDQESQYLYNKEKSFSTSSGKNYREVYSYPQNFDNDEYSGMVTRNQLKTPVQIQKYVDDQKTFDGKGEYDTTAFQGYKLIKQLVQVKDQEDYFEEFRIEYDIEGNIISLIDKDDLETIFVWGYHKEYPIAKIVNPPSSDGLLSFGSLSALSNADNDNTLGYLGNEGALREALDNLRSSPEMINAQVTSYTYDPLIGVTSQTDPRGYTMYYVYDEKNRLEFVKDSNGNILSQNEYNYILNN